MTERQQLVLVCLRAASAGEWTGAAQVADRMRRAGDEKASAVGVGRMLSKLAEDGYCSRTGAEGAWTYRAPLHAVVVYDSNGDEAGRLLLWASAGRGLELDLSQLAETLPEQEWRLRLDERDVRTVRASCDEALFR